MESTTHEPYSRPTPPEPVRVAVNLADVADLHDRLTARAYAAAAARWTGRIQPARLLWHIIRLRRWLLTWQGLAEEAGISGSEAHRMIRARALYGVLCDEADAHGIKPPWERAR